MSNATAQTPNRNQQRLGLVALVLAFAIIPPITQKLLQSPPPTVELVMYGAPAEVPAIAFQSANGERVTLEDFKGRFVLLNVWATWCPPCRQEMPSLDNLAGMFSPSDLQVVALSVDVSGLPRVEYFYREMSLERMSIYVDPSMIAMQKLGIIGIPTTLLLNREGLAIGRLGGPTKWDDPAMVERLRSTINAETHPTPSTNETTDEMISPQAASDPLPATEDFSTLARELARLGLQ